MPDVRTPIGGAMMILLAARGLGKVDLYGMPRGVTMISTEEIEAMALLLASMGLSPLQPGADAPADVHTLFNPI